MVEPMGQLFVAALEFVTRLGQQWASVVWPIIQAYWRSHTNRYDLPFRGLQRPAGIPRRTSGGHHGSYRHRGRNSQIAPTKKAPHGAPFLCSNFRLRRGLRREESRFIEWSIVCERLRFGRCNSQGSHWPGDWHPTPRCLVGSHDRRC